MLKFWTIFEKIFFLKIKNFGRFLKKFFF